MNTDRQTLPNGCMETMCESGVGHPPLMGGGIILVIWMLVYGVHLRLFGANLTGQQDGSEQSAWMISTCCHRLIRGQ